MQAMIEDIDKKIHKFYKKIGKLEDVKAQKIMEKNLRFYKAFYDIAKYLTPTTTMVDILNRISTAKIEFPEGIDDNGSS